MVRTFNDSTSQNIRKVINTVYYKSCDTWKYPIVGVIPKEQHCCDCKNCTRVSVNYQYLVFLFIFYFIFFTSYCLIVEENMRIYCVPILKLSNKRNSCLI